MYKEPISQLYRQRGKPTRIRKARKKNPIPDTFLMKRMHMARRRPKAISFNDWKHLINNN